MSNSPSRALNTTLFLRLITTSALMFLISPSTLAIPTPEPTVVHPTGSFPLDLQNVQTAVNLGGTVLLKATNLAGHPTAFNFGQPPPGHITGAGVDLTTDVAIVGERIGRAVTTINAGANVFVGRIAVKSHIEGIDFEAPLGAAIVLVASTGTEIVGNHINGVIGVPSGFGTNGDGIDIFGSNDPQNAITGHVIIANNVIENLGADFNGGVSLDEVSADVSISGNTFRSAHANGSHGTSGITVIRSHNRVSIIGNEVTFGPGNPDAEPAAIIVEGDHDARYVIALNNVVIDHPNADGIVVTGGDFTEPTQGAVIVANRVTIRSSRPFLAGIDLFGAVSDSLVAANSIRGSSDFAMDIGEGDFSTSLSDGDKLLGNDISRHTSLTADVYLGTNTSDIVFAGHCSSDIDLGVDNQIQCNAPIGRTADMAQSPNPRAQTRDVLKMKVRGAMLQAIRQRVAK